MIALIAGYGLAADRRWTAVPEGDLKNVPVIRDIVTSANDIFAVGDMGLFYHSGSGSLTRIQSPSNDGEMTIPATAARTGRTSTARAAAS